MTSATAENTVNKLRQTFATHGLPQIIVSDNGSNFASEHFKQFCDNNGIKHIFVSPYKPSSNGMAERAVQTIKNGLKKAKLETAKLETGLYRFLLTYNKIPQSTTGIAPCELLMKRKLRSRIDLIKPDISVKVEDSQSKMKERYDTKSKKRSFYCGDKVFVQNFIGLPKWIPGSIETVLGPLTYQIRLTMEGYGDAMKIMSSRYTSDSVHEERPIEEPVHAPLNPQLYQTPLEDTTNATPVSMDKAPDKYLFSN